MGYGYIYLSSMWDFAILCSYRINTSGRDRSLWARLWIHKQGCFGICIWIMLLDLLGWIPLIGTIKNQLYNIIWVGKKTASMTKWCTFILIKTHCNVWHLFHVVKLMFWRSSINAGLWNDKRTNLKTDIRRSTTPHLCCHSYALPMVLQSN